MPTRPVGQPRIFAAIASASRSSTARAVLSVTFFAK
jgi:hypothetical protein